MQWFSEDEIISMLPAADRERMAAACAEFEREIEVRRADALEAKNTAEFIDAANSYLDLADSFSRPAWMLDLFAWRGAAGAPGEFWPVFLANWSMCDGVADLKEDLLDQLYEVTGQEPALTYQEAVDREFFAGLPKSVTVYRGCSRVHAEGISWTRNRKTAEFFARPHRVPVTDPVIVTARVRKERIFAVLTDRQESEVLCDPRIIRIEPLCATGRAPHAA
jgi:hypothetical protein